jgi:hypothetical protein
VEVVSKHCENKLSFVVSEVGEIIAGGGDSNIESLVLKLSWKKLSFAVPKGGVYRSSTFCWGLRRMEFQLFDLDRWDGQDWCKQETRPDFVTI